MFLFYLRQNGDEIIYFNAVGAGIMDIAVAARCYKNAVKFDKGIKLPFWELSDIFLLCNLLQYIEKA